MNFYSQPSSSQIYTVGKLTQDIKYLLEEKYDIIWISGEISNFRIPSSGHAYFTLKDDKAQISAVMFKGQLRQIKFDLENGATIVAMGRITVYEPRGNYQIILEYVEPKGIGALQIAFDQLKRKLADEGLFDESHKKALPFLSQNIAIITSLYGAVLQDILKIIGRRFVNMSVDICPVHVQGDTAANEIVNALKMLNKRDNAADVVILARGGGSMEDLAAFNTEIVAREIFSSKIPVVSAVGHETDFTIADFVADLRAPTPSAAAELVVPVKEELVWRCKDLQSRCHRSVLAIIKRLHKENKSLRRRLIHPRKRIQASQLHLDDLHQRLVRNVLQSIEKHHLKLERCQSALNALNPLAVLKRGYSITRTLPQCNVISSSEDVELNQSLEVILYKGVLNVTVTDKQKRN